MERPFLPHLNTQTNSNLSFSFLKIPQLVDWAKEKQLNYVAIADYYPYEITEFFNLCKVQKIKPVWGVKIFLQGQAEKKKYFATIYPQNTKGYKEVLQKLFSPEALNDRIFVPENIFSTLSKNCLIVLEAQKLEEINYFATQWILVSTPKKEVNYSNIFIGFSFFLLNPTQSISQNILPLLLPFFSIKSLTSEEIKLLPLLKKTTFTRHFFVSDTSGNFLPYLNTEEYFSHCTNDKSFYQLLLIQWQTFLAKINLSLSTRREKSNKSKQENSLLLLKSKCWQKLLSLRKENEPNYQKILEKELTVIEKLNYSDYLLVFSEVANYLKKKNIIVGPGRGSAVSSLTVYLLGITSVDPLQHNLIFERFLNEKRKNLPDIDLDVENQEEVFNYLQQKYPKNQLARLITKKKIGWKTAFQEVAKFYRIEGTKLKEIVSLVGKDLTSSSSPKLQNWKLRYPALFVLVEKIQDLYYDTGIHPAGIVIAEHSLNGLVPLKAEKGYLLMLFEENKLNQLGLKKYDFLSLRETFSFIHETREILQIALPDYSEINFQDEKTWKLLRNFLLTGIFQLDTLSARALFSRFLPQSFSELVLFLALNRPGTKKKVEEIVQKKITKDKISLVSPAVQKILSETYGFIIFEEQISQIFALVYDCSFAEAEIKRRELAEKGLEKDFPSKAKKKMSFTESNLIYRQVNSAIGYTFNKAHAVAYSYLTYYIVYLKANFFPKLIAHFLNKKKEKNLSYLQEAFFFGFQIKGPDINQSEINWVKKEQELIMGFSNLKEYSEEFFQEIIEERKKRGIYKNWEDFLNRTINYWENVENTILEEWVKSGLFDSLQVDSHSLLENKEAIFRYLRIRKKIPVLNSSLPFLDLPTGKEEKKAENNKREYESLGLYITYFSRWKKLAEKSDYKLSSLVEIFQKIEEYDNQELSINIYAIITQIEKKSEKNYTIFLQDIRNSFRLNIELNVYLENKGILVIHNELLFSLKVEIKEGKINSLTYEGVKEI